MMISYGARSAGLNEADRALATAFARQARYAQHSSERGATGYAFVWDESQVQILPFRPSPFTLHRCCGAV